MHTGELKNSRDRAIFVLGNFSGTLPALQLWVGLDVFLELATSQKLLETW